MARKTTALFLWGSLSLFPVTAFAQSATTCFQLTPTNDTKINVSSLLTKEAAVQALPVGLKASLYTGKLGSDQRLCYGPFDTLQDAAVFAVGWADTQPLSSLNIRVSGLSFFTYTAPDKKNEAKLSAPQSFSVATQAFASTLQASFDRSEIHVGVVAPAKSYAFAAPDASMPPFEEDTLELVQNQNLLSLGQESWCEETTGCLFWEKVLVGEDNTVAYVPSGHVLFTDQFISSPDNSWKLFARARGTISFVPDHRSSVNNPQPTLNSSSTVVVSLWAMGIGKEGFDSLGNAEVPGTSPSSISIRFTPEGIALQSSEPNRAAASLALNTAKYKTVDGPASPVASADPQNPAATNATASVTPSKPAAKPKPAVKYYTVRTGDSLWLISSKFGITVEQLRKANGLSKKAVLQPGQKLVIPAKPKH